MSNESTRPTTPETHPGDQAPPGTPGTGENTCRTCQGTGKVDGKKITKSTKITAEKSRELLKEDIAEAARAVDELVHPKYPLTQHQKAALVSFVFNVGRGNFQNSTMLRLLNTNQIDAAAQQFARWNQAGGKVLRGLVNRRAYEKQMFLTAD